MLPVTVRLLIDVGGDDDDWADAVTRRETMAAVVRFESDITAAINAEAEAEAQSPVIYLPSDFFPPLIDVKPCRVLKTIDVDDDLTIVATTRFIFLENRRDGRHHPRCPSPPLPSPPPPPSIHPSPVPTYNAARNKHYYVHM